MKIALFSLALALGFMGPAANSQSPTESELPQKPGVYAIDTTAHSTPYGFTHPKSDLTGTLGTTSRAAAFI